MSYLNNLNKLLALDIEQLSKFNRPGGKVVFIPSKDSCFLGVRLSLLPQALSHKFLSDVSVSPPVTENTQQYKVIARLIQEDMTTKRLDFYSRELELSPNGVEDSVVLNRIRHDISGAFKGDHWVELQTSDSLTLAFTYNELQLTVMLETLADIQVYPFWSKLHSDFHLHYPSDHIPVLGRYAHFVIRQKSNAQ